MEFEKLLLETLKEAENVAQWKDLLEEQIAQVSGDDFSLTLWIGSYKDFETMKETLMERLSYMKETYPSPGELSEEELFHQWETYRDSYEFLWTAGEK